MYAISRVEVKSGIWCWAVQFRRRGKPYYKSFYDMGRGGSRKALRAAIAWRNQQLARTRPLSFREFRQVKRSDNRSGEVGVIFQRQPRMLAGFWQARLKLPNGKQLTRSFGVRKYGKREAFRRAVEARAELLLLVEDRPYIQHPTAKRIARRTTVEAWHGNH
jgi:hypothetical protein